MLWLQQYTVKDLALPQPLVTVSLPDDTLFVVIERLASHRLLCVPVLDADGALVGMLDGLDIAAHIIRLCANGAEELVDCPLDEVKDFQACSADGLPCVGLEDSLESVVALLSGPARRCVVMKEDRPLSIVTQSLALQFLRQHMAELDEATLTSPARSSKNLLCVTEEQTAYDAFRVLAEERISSCGVVDESGALLMVLSATDMVMGVAHMKDKRSALTVLRDTNVVDFLSSERLNNPKDRVGAIVVGPQAEFEQVVDKLSRCRIHQVVVAEERRPCGIIRLGDICKQLTSVEAAEPVAP